MEILMHKVNAAEIRIDFAMEYSRKLSMGHDLRPIGHTPFTSIYLSIYCRNEYMVL